MTPANDPASSIHVAAEDLKFTMSSDQEPVVQVPSGSRLTLETGLSWHPGMAYRAYAVAGGIPPPAQVWPRVETTRHETTRHIGAIGCARPLEDAFGISVEELMKWMVAEHDVGSPEAALLLLGTVAEARATQQYNPKATYITKIDKQFLVTI